MGDELCFECLNDKNYRKWKVYMEAHLIRKLLWIYLPHCASSNPAVIWSTIADIHISRGHSTVTMLHCQLHKLCLERSESMPTYIAQAHTIAHKLIDAGHHISDDNLLLAITAGLL
ncbi:hypothetical protein P691DRAFT_687153 [Macrolepiota fuliginosa MF-IS2]|uniref:DUF4219 domain-containing protein n=1 Tax=Macrolepiota fuliginosa MF-IS2 TaxID=1400762 RepID=A0A9P5WWZ0_9AGAR|nr:hypothetical protein P691DRAFT_687153 [Macrolepiota fuliginosa MF-IS2]